MNLHRCGRHNSQIFSVVAFKFREVDVIQGGPDEAYLFIVMHLLLLPPCRGRSPVTRGRVTRTRVSHQHGVSHGSVIWVLLDSGRSPPGRGRNRGATHLRP